MKALLIFTAILLFSGCDGMTNDEIIKEVKKCRDNNLSVGQYINPFTNDVRIVRCEFREKQ